VKIKGFQMHVFREGKIKKTRKPHRCCGCGRIIPVGKTVRYQVNTYDDRLGTAYWHGSNECEESAKVEE
jgi:hypothetical protein